MIGERRSTRGPDAADPALAARLAAARAGDQYAFGGLTEPYRRELQVHCYRILGSLQDAEDLVQETLLRAWRRIDSFEGRASFRAWLYKIATNACLDALDKRLKRTLPTAMHPPADAHQPAAPPIAEPLWIEPFPDDLIDEGASSPEARYELHESVSLAFLVALQLLPPRQRAALILRDVLDWRASEAAAQLELSVSAVNSLLHRARTTLARYYRAGGREMAPVRPTDETTRALLDRYVRAWEAADVAALVALLTEDARLSMPPSPSWYQGRQAIGAFLSSMLSGSAADSGARLLPTRANAQPAFGLYQRDQRSGVYRAFAIQVLRVEGARLADITNFLDPALFARLGLPGELS